MFTEEEPDSTPAWYAGIFTSLLVCLPWLATIVSNRILGQDERIGDRANSLWLHSYAASEWSIFDPFGQVDIFLHPYGIDLWAELFNVFDAFVALPLVWIFGWGPHYNILIVLLSVFAVWGGRMWASRFTDDGNVAWIAGLLFAGGTSMLYAVELGRVVQVGIGVVTLGLWSLHQLRNEGTWRHGVMAGLAVGLAGSWYLYWGYGLVLCALLLCPWRRAFTEIGWWLFASIGALVLWWNVVHLNLDYLAQEAAGQGSFPTLSVAFSPEHFETAGSIIEGALPIGWFGVSSTHSISILLIGLALLGRRKERLSEGWLLWLGIVIFSVLGMGPYLMSDTGLFRVDGHVLQNPIYLWLYEHMPLVSRMHWLHRWLPFLGALILPWSIKGLQQLGRGMWVIPLLLIGEWGWKGHFLVSSTPSIESTCYAGLMYPDKPILLLPFSHSSRGAVFQPIHKHPIVNPIGISYEPSRWPESYKEKLTEPIYQWAMKSDGPIKDLSPTTEVMRSAQSEDLSHIVYHKHYLQDALLDPSAPMQMTVDDDARIDSITKVFGASNCSDEHIVVWTVQPL